MGSPEAGGGGRGEKEVSKRRKSESTTTTHYVKDHHHREHYEDEEPYEEDLRSRSHRSSKSSRKSSKSDRGDREKGREREKEKEKEKEKDRGDRGSRYYEKEKEKGEKRSRGSLKDDNISSRHEQEGVERDDYSEFVSSRGGSGKRRNGIEKASSKKGEVTVVEKEEEEEEEEEDRSYGGAASEEILRSTSRAIEKEKVRRNEYRGERGAPADVVVEEDVEKVGKKGLDEEVYRKRDLRGEGSHGHDDDETSIPKIDIRAEYKEYKEETLLRRSESRAERPYDVEEARVRKGDPCVEKARENDHRDELRNDKVYGFDDSKPRKIDSRAEGGKVDNVEEEILFSKSELRSERSGRTSRSSAHDPGHSKSRRSHIDDEREGRGPGRDYAHDPDEETRVMDLQFEKVETFRKHATGAEDHPRSRSQMEKSREHGDWGKESRDRTKIVEDVQSGDRIASMDDTDESHGLDRKRSGREKVRGARGEREERGKETGRGDRIGSNEQERVEVKSGHSELPRAASGSKIVSEKVVPASLEISKEKLASRWDKPNHPMWEEVLEPMKERASRGDRSGEMMESRWDESEEAIMHSSKSRKEKHISEGRKDGRSRGRDNADMVVCADLEESLKSGVLEKMGESTQIVEYEESLEVVHVEASAVVDVEGKERGDESRPEKPERHRREREMLERAELDEWAKTAEYRDREERERGEESRRFDHHHGRDKSELEGLDDGSKLAGSKEDRGEEVPRSARRRGRETLEREDSDFGGRFLGREERDRERSHRDRDRDRDRERERDREKEKERERERGGRRDDNFRDDRRKGRERRDERYDEYDAGARSSAKGRVDRGDYEREKYRSREKLDSGWEEIDDVHGRSSTRERREEEREGKTSYKKPMHEAVVRGVSVSKEKGDEEKLGRSSRPEEEKGKKLVARENVEDEGFRIGGTKVEDSADRTRGRARERVDSGLQYSDDGARSKGRHRSYKGGVGSRSPDDRRGRSDWEGGERDWSDDKEDYERERSSTRRGSQKRDRDSGEREQDRYRSRERPHDKSWERERERERGRDQEETLDRSRDRHRDRRKERDERGRDLDYPIEQDSWEPKKRHEKTEREKLERERFEQESSEHSRMERERVDGFRSSRGFGAISDSGARGNNMPLNFMDCGRAYGGPYIPPGGEFYQGDYVGGFGENDWDAAMMDDRMRIREGIFLGPGERYMEDEGPLGHDPGFGPGRGDGGMGYPPHPGRGGRGSKGSPSNRGGRGGMMGPDGRGPHFNNPPGGPLLQGMQQQQHQQQQQQGAKGRGPRGGPKGIRGPGREGPRGGVNPPLMGPGPGMGPPFGPMGPQGPMPGMGMGPGPGPGMGQFPMPPFGGPMWGGGRGGGEMGMMGCPPGPPGPGMGPGLGPRFGPVPGPNMFFSPPGTGRGGPGGMFPGVAPPFVGPGGGGGGGGGGGSGSGRGQMGDRGPPGASGRGVMGRGNGAPGRGPSRGEQNDYSQHFVDTGLRPQNFIRDVELADRFEEYPKLKELITRKDQLIQKRATPPMYMQCDLQTTELCPEMFGTKFDVILVDPPWEEYVRRAPGIGDSMEWWSAEEIQNLRIEAIADTPAFIFLWVGDAEGLEQGRLCLKKWGFRRCEDICWVKTNRENPTPALRHDSNTLFQHSKEHCLMGIKGTVRRSTDGHIIHANVDTDIMISEEPEYGSTKKPEELYHIIEHFAQGQRRIELFGEDHNIRAGWVTVGKGLTSSNFKPQTYAKNFADADGKVWQGGRGNPAFDAPHLVGTTPEIEALRPKSPPPRPQQAQPSGQGNAGTSMSQPSGGNSNSKKTSTGQVGGLQNGQQPPALIPGAGHGSANPLGGGAMAIGQPPQVGGRGGGHGQIPKLRLAIPGAPMMKPLGAGPGIAEVGGIDEEASYGGGDLQETMSTEEVVT